MSETTPNPPPHGYGDAQMTIALPNAGESLGLRFSVFGKCSAISMTTTPTMSVVLNDGGTQVATGNLTMNPQKGTYEAVFNLPAGTSIKGTGQVVVTCSGMTTPATCGQLSVTDQTVIGITQPREGSSAGGSWTGVVANGTVAAEFAGKALWLRVTDRGFDLLQNAFWMAVPNDGNWSVNISQLPLAARVQNPTGANFGIHVSLWETQGGAELMRISSGYFSVGV